MAEIEPVSPLQLPLGFGDWSCTGLLQEKYRVLPFLEKGQYLTLMETPPALVYVGVTTLRDLIGGGYC